jgi:hypothetical protein
MTNEQELARQEKVAFRFMRLHPDYHPCDANARLINEWLTAQGLSFTDDNLTMAAQALDGELAKQSAKPTTPTAPAVLSEEELAEQERQAFISSLPPLPKSWVQITTAQDVHDLSASDYRRCYHAASPHGENFRKRVEAIMAHEKIGTDTQGWARRKS